MAKFGLNKAKLEMIQQGFVEVKEIIAKATEATNLRGLVRDLRRIPVSDRDKKRELAAFFQLPEASQYSTAEKYQAYNDVLGYERNRRQLG